MAESMTKEEEQQLAQQLLRTPMMGAPVNSRPTASIPQPPAQQQNPLMNTAQSAIAQPNSAVSELAGLLRRTPSVVTPPENFGQGVKNVLTNTVVRPLQYKLGLRESPTQRLTRLKTDRASLGLYQDYIDLAKQRGEIESIQAFDLSALEKSPAELRAMQALKDTSTDIEQFMEEYSRALTSSRAERDRLLTNSSKDSLFFAKLLSEEGPGAYQVALQLRDELNPSDTAKAYREFERLPPLEKQKFLALSFDEKQMIMQQTNGDMSKYFAALAKGAASIAKAERIAADGGLDLTPGQRAIDEAYKEVYSDFVVKGGSSKAISNISQLDDSVRQLNKDPSLTGRQFALRPDTALPAATLALKENVARVVTQGMKEIIGAAFAASEADQFISRSFNQILPASVNAERLRRLRAGMKLAFEAKNAAARHYEKFGTLSNWEPGVGSLNKSLVDFEKLMYQPDDYMSLDRKAIESIITNPLTNQFELDAVETHYLKRFGGNGK
jgi:hypothetical protein